MVANSYHFQDPNQWKDLPSKFVLQLWRDVHLLGRPDVARELWADAVAAMEHLAATDRDGDGLPDHDGADQTFDTWPMTGPSAYAGGLYVAALAAMEHLAPIVGESPAGFAERRTHAASSLTSLWTGSYLRYDRTTDTVMADQLCGVWWCDATGLAPFLAAGDVRQALATIMRLNVRSYAGGARGAVNGMRPDGSVDDSSEQSQEVWPAVTYTLAALLLVRGLDQEAWEAIRGAIRVTYEEGFQFRTPEAWDADGNFRASLYMRPLAIWAIEHALRTRR
jgi:non-lysosomal glucosylceramidase